MTVTSASGVPTVKLFDSDQGLIFGMKSAASSTEANKLPQTPATPQQVEPGSETQPEETSESEDESINILVTGEQESEEHRVPNASTATRTNTPIRDIPQSIQVIPRQVLEDQQVIRLDEALSNISCVTRSGTMGNTSVNFNIRGFENAPVLLDGFREFGGFEGSIPDSKVQLQVYTEFNQEE